VDLDRRMQLLRGWQRLLDTAFRVPGTSIRFGWDPIVGLIPWVGDVATALFACALIVEAHRMRVPRVLQFRMLVNVAVDVLMGLVPFIGDVADVFWKANSRNMAMIERHVAQPRPATAGDYLFVAAVLTAVVLVAAVPLVLMYWLVYVVIQRPLV
jgi:hypothetical protein